MTITKEIEQNFNYMVISRKGEKYRTYKYDTAKRFLEAEGGRLYFYAYQDLKHTIRLLVEWSE